MTRDLEDPQGLSTLGDNSLRQGPSAHSQVLGVARNLALPEAPAGKQRRVKLLTLQILPALTTSQPHGETNANQRLAFNDTWVALWGRSWPMSQGSRTTSFL